MKILFITARGDAFGGATLHVRDMARRLMDDGHEVKILVGGHPDMVVARRFAEKDLDFQCIPSMGRAIHPWKDARAMISIRREIRRFAPDMISTHASKGGALGRLAALGTGIPTIYTPHCWAFVEGFRKAGLYLRIERFLARFTSRIVTVSRWERRFGLESRVGTESRTVTIHNGVVETPVLLRRPSLAEDAPIRIVMTARFEEQKDHALLLETLASLYSLDWHLTFVGDGPLLEECRLLARELDIEDRIEFAGYSSTVEQYLARADIFALISKWEGFPRSILEAMRAGLPVITSDAGGSSEAISHGKSGFVVCKGDLNSLEDALFSLISDVRLRDEMGHMARKVYLENFTFETMYQQYIRLYRTLSSAAERESIVSPSPSTKHKPSHS